MNIAVIGLVLASYVKVKLGEFMLKLKNEIYTIGKKLINLKNVLFMIPVLITIVCALGEAVCKKQILGVIAFGAISVFANLLLARVIYSVFKILDISFSKAEFLVICISYILFCTYVIFSSLHRDFIYYWDYSLYIHKQYGLEGIFREQGCLGGIKEIFKSYNYEYTHCINVFLEFPFCLTSRTPNAYIFTQLINSVLPTVFLLSALIKKIYVKVLKNKKELISYFILALSTLLLYPLLYVNVLKCVPDQFGLIFCFLIILLTLEEDFSVISWKKFLILYLVTALLIVTRRWYVFFIIGYYCTWGISRVCYVIRDWKKENKIATHRLKNIAVVSLVYLMLTILFFYKMASRIIANNYAEKYIAYKGNGLWGEMIHQSEIMGYGLIILVLLGLYLYVYKKQLCIALITVGGYFISLFLFTRIQNMGDHQSLLLLPYYYLLIIGGVALICNINQGIFRKISIIVVIIAILGNTYINFFQNRMSSTFVSSVNLVLTPRDDMDEIRALAKWLNENCGSSVNERAYIIPHSGAWVSGAYCPDMFRNAFLPDTSLKNKIYYGSAVLGTHEFPLGLLTAKYVLTCNPFPQHFSTSALAEKYNDLFLNYEHLYEKFELIQEFDMGNGTVFYCYHRIAQADMEEVAYYKDAMQEESKMFPELFENLLDSFVEKNIN